MRDKKRHQAIAGLLTTLLLGGAVATAWAQSTPDTIKIQGYLSQNISGVITPVDTTVSMTFTLYDQSDASLATDVHDANQGNGVSVIKGIYEVDLHFGADLFNGRDRYLELSVNQQVLAPKLKMASAPFAYQAEKLDGLEGTELVKKTGDTMTGELKVPSIMFDGGRQTIPFTGAAAGSLDAAYDFGGSGQGRTITADAGAVTVLGSPTSGNASTYQVLVTNGPHNLSLGATALAGEIQSWGGAPLSLNPGGNSVGIGTTNPQASLDVYGGAFGLSGPGLNGSTYQRFMLYADASNGLLFEAPKNPSGNKLPIHFNWRGGGPDGMTVSPGGNVQFQGTATGAANVAFASFHDSAGTRTGYVGDGNNTTGVQLGSEVGNVTLNSALGPVLTATQSGNVGIGTATPATDLDVYSTNSGSGLRVKAVVSGTVFGPIGASLTLDRAGPGGSSSSQVAFLTAGVSDFAMGTSQGSAASSDFSVYDYGIADNVLTISKSTGNIGIGTTDPQAKLDVRGQVNVGVLQIDGADIAEPFEISGEDLPKGTVVVIDEDNPGRVRQSDRAYDKRVAGILSGANGVRSGISLKQEGFNDRGQNVALSGRVYTLCDASYDAIGVGDPLTTSDTAGHCMKAADGARSDGAIIGKAMSSLSAGQGMVLVLVSLQ